METVDEIIKIVMNSGEEEEEVVEEVEEVEITQEPEVLAADAVQPRKSNYRRRNHEEGEGSSAKTYLPRTKSGQGAN